MHPDGQSAPTIPFLGSIQQLQPRGAPAARLCAGAALSRTSIVTAASCVAGVRKGLMRVVVGTDDLAVGGTTLR